MKISCNKSILATAVMNVSRVTLGKSSLKVLEGILFKASENRLYLSGYDLETGISTSIEAVVLEEGDVVLPARTVSDIVKSSATERIEIECDDKFNVKITAGKAEFDILGIPSIEYPELPTYNEIGNFKISQKKLKSMIMQTLYAVAQDNDRPILTGTLFDLAENMLCLVSVDGSRLAVRREEIEFDDSHALIVPGKALAEISKILLDDDEKDISISFGRKQINFIFNDYKVMSRLIEGDFIDYNRIIPIDNTLSLRVNTREFIESIERLSSVNTEKAKAPIRCSFKDNQITFTCTTTIGQGKDVINCEMEGQEIELGFNSRNLIEAFKSSELDEVLVTLKNATSPMTIKPLNGDSFVYLVLPTRK
ncbi:MAG: DNA polymerase III subunit beta [Oscillospiraceae bacterium]|nr:DNA polymerase III subunit beta [Oscillospiraceae bacterium]